MKHHPILVETRIPPFPIWSAISYIISILIFTYLAYLYFSSGISAEVISSANKLNDKYETNILSPLIGVGFSIMFGGGIPLALLVQLILKIIKRDPVPPKEYEAWLKSGQNQL